MANYNLVILIGRLSRDPTYRVLPNSQTPMCDFSIASNSKYKTKSGETRENVVFIDCVAFSGLADTINKYCRKGKEIQVVGRLKLDVWEDKAGGGKRSKHSIIVDSIQFLGAKDEAPAPSPSQSNGAGGGQHRPDPAPGEDASSYGEADIPF